MRLAEAEQGQALDESRIQPRVVCDDVAVLGAIAELERSLIAGRVRAGLRNARAKGKKLGRPRRIVDARRVASRRAQGMGWKKVVGELGVSDCSTIFSSGSARKGRRPSGSSSLRTRAVGSYSLIGA